MSRRLAPTALRTSITGTTPKPLGGALSKSLSTSSFPQSRAMDADEVLSRLASGEKATVVDVRSWEEFSSRERIKGAVNVPLASLEHNCALLQDKEKEGPIITVCQSGNRSARAADLLEARGFKRVVSLGGGMNKVASCAAAPDLIEGADGGSKVWEMERQVRATAGGMVLIGTLLGIFVHPSFLALPAFVGSGLVYSAVSNTCGMAAVLMKMPWNKVKKACDLPGRAGSS